MGDAAISSSAASLMQATDGLRVVPGPERGWLRAVRESLGLSRRSVAETLHVSDAAVRDYELAEAAGAISLRTLRRAANALGCEVVIALVPMNRRSFAELAGIRDEHRAPPVAIDEPPAGIPPEESGDLESHLK